MMPVIPAQAGIQNLLCPRVLFLDPGLRRGDALSRKFNAVDCKEVCLRQARFCLLGRRTQGFKGDQDVGILAHHAHRVVFAIANAIGQPV